MKLYPCRCPHCGAELPVSNDQRILFCSYCGSSLYAGEDDARSDSGSADITSTTIIRDEARIKEAENEAARLQYHQMRRAYRQEQRAIREERRREKSEELEERLAQRRQDRLLAAAARREEMAERLEEKRLERRMRAAIRREEKAERMADIAETAATASAGALMILAKGFLAIVVIALIFFFGLLYTVSPIDLMPGLPLDDLLIIAGCFWVGSRIMRARE